LITFDIISLRADILHFTFDIAAAYALDRVAFAAARVHLWLRFAAAFAAERFRHLRDDAMPHAAADLRTSCFITQRAGAVFVTPRACWR